MEKFVANNSSNNSSKTLLIWALVIFLGLALKDVALAYPGQSLDTLHIQLVQGEIEILGWDNSYISVDHTPQVWTSVCQLRQKQYGSIYRIGVSPEHRNIFPNCITKLTVKIPRHWNVVAKGKSVDFLLRGLAGPAKVTSNHGEIRVEMFQHPQPGQMQLRAPKSKVSIFTPFNQRLF